MLGGLTSALSSALAPDVPPVADFRHHWNSFLKYYDCSGGGGGGKKVGGDHGNLRSSRPVEQTHQVHHLNAMMKLLAQEQKEKVEQQTLKAAGGNGQLAAATTEHKSMVDAAAEKVLYPCMEYLVHHQVLDILSTLCQADVPPGIRPTLIRFFVYLVGHVDQVVLPYVSVYLPIRRLLALFCSGKASPTESQELSFIVTLIANLTKNPELLTLFAHQPTPGDVSHSSSSKRVSRASSTLELSVLPFLENVKTAAAAGMSTGGVSAAKDDHHQKAAHPLKDYDGKHLLMSAVLNYVDSADYLVSCQAMDALIAVSAFKDDSAAFDAVQGTDVCGLSARRLGDLLSALDDVYLAHPFDVGSIEEIKVSWMEAHHLFRPLSTSNNYQHEDFSGKAELVAFFSWLDFCDDLVEKAHDVISDGIVMAIEEDFFHHRLEKCLWSTAHHEAVTSGGGGDETATADSKVTKNSEQANDESKLHLLRLAILTQMWLHINSEGLAMAFTRWLFGSGGGGGPERRGDVTQTSIKRKLLEFCMAFDDSLALEALRLIDTLLDRPCQPILESLLLNNLQSRAYFQNFSPESSHMNSWSDEEDEREKIRRVRQKTPPSSAAAIAASKSASVSCSDQLSGSRTLAPANVSKVINKWLFLYPEELRCNDESICSTYEQYVSNAEAQVEATFQSCEGFEWPSEAVSEDVAVLDEEEEVDDRQRPHSTTESSSNTSDASSKPEAERRGATKKDGGGGFYEGDFLSMLFDMVENMLENSYDINLQLTAIISKLALLPHPNVHEFLLNPTIPLVEGPPPPPRTLYGALEAVLAKGKAASDSVPNLQKKILACKRNLLGSPQVVSSPLSDKPELSLDEKETKLIDALIILEEFCKELAAITLVKYNAVAPHST